MKTSIKLIVIIILIASFTNAYGARYYITNKGAQTVTVKLDVVERDEDFEVYYFTLTADNLRHGQTVERDAGGGKYVNVVYLLPAGSGKLPLLPVTNGMKNSGDKFGKLAQSLDKDHKDYTIDVISKPDPNNPKNLLWTIDAKPK